jgi:hypothetical protein
MHEMVACDPNFNKEINSTKHTRICLHPTNDKEINSGAI